jgi:hypothetical protein
MTTVLIFKTGTTLSNRPLRVGILTLMREPAPKYHAYSFIQTMDNIQRDISILISDHHTNLQIHVTLMF